MHTMESKNRNGNKKYAAFEMLLLKNRETLSHRLRQRLGDVSVHGEPEDDAGLAVHSFATDLAVDRLERERQELAEIESALERIKASEYGICEGCAGLIREARLEALPWARLCIRCAARVRIAERATD
jgi:DnaK suppressor protein